MKKTAFILFVPLLLSGCFFDEIQKVPEGKEDGYVFYKGIRRFLSDGTEIEPLVNTILIDGEEVDIGSEESRERIVSVRKDRNRLDCYCAPSEDDGFYFFSLDFPTGTTSEPKPVVGNPRLLDLARLPGTRDSACLWQSDGATTYGVLRDGVAYPSEKADAILFVSARGEYESFAMQETVDGVERYARHLVYRPFPVSPKSNALGERIPIMAKDGIHFLDFNPTSPHRIFFTEGDDPRWYRFSEETLELEDLGPYEQDRYRFLSLDYEGSPSYGEPTSTRYIVEEGTKTLVKDLADPSYLLDVTDRIPEVENIVFAGYSEDLDFFYYSLWDERNSGDGYLESEQRWVGADLTHRMKRENGRRAEWGFSYPYLKTERYEFWVNVDNKYRYLDLTALSTFIMVRNDLVSKETYATGAKRLGLPSFGFTLRVPFLYDYVDTKGDEILEIGPSLSPMMNAPK